MYPNGWVTKRTTQENEMTQFDYNARVPADDADGIGRMAGEDFFPTGTPIMLFVNGVERVSKCLRKILGDADEGQIWVCPIRNGMGYIREMQQVQCCNVRTNQIKLM